MNRILYWTIVFIIGMVFGFIYQYILPTPDFASYVLGMLLIIPTNILDIIDKEIRYKEEEIK